MTDTPETDAARITEKTGCIATFCGMQVVPVEFARRIERERDEARKEARLETARVSASLMAIESLERDRSEAQLLVKTLSDQCDMIEEDKEYNAQLANQFKAERDQLKDYIESARRAGKNLKQTYQSISKENSHLKAINAELLTALYRYDIEDVKLGELDEMDITVTFEDQQITRAAISKALES